MECNKNFPFPINSKVMGMALPTYLDWAAGTGDYPKRLLLPPIQRGFVWKPLQIAQLWDSLLRGMPIGSLMVSKLLAGQNGTDLGPIQRKVEKIESDAIGLLDGQQRTLAMLLGWNSAQASNHCVWVDLAETGRAGSPFELRISTRTQPFGLQRHSHGKLSRQERREARKDYNGHHEEHVSRHDFELFDYGVIRPWKAAKSSALCFPIKELWATFRAEEGQGMERYVTSKLSAQSTTGLVPGESKLLQTNLIKLQKAFERFAMIEVPLILVPDHISQPPADDLAAQVDAPALLTLLFERIGRNGASLSSEDLLFSMIKQQWPDAHDLVETLHKGKIGYLMSATDYVMTAYRLAAAEEPGNIEDTPRPSPNDFHRHLGVLIRERNGEKMEGTLRSYLSEKSLLTAFNSLYETLKYRGNGDIGLPDLMLPHLSRGLIQVILRWFMLNQPDAKMLADNRQSILAFTLFWYLCIWHEDKASKKAFGMLGKGNFPASKLSRSLIEPSSKDETGLALPLISPDRLKDILADELSPLLRAGEEMFSKRGDTKLQERDLYKRFCWWRKPVLLWLQREYVQRKTDENCWASFAGLTDEDAVPYDYDHLCPQNHWGSHWGKIDGTSLTDDMKDFMYRGRSDVGNSIGNLHVLDSSLNRSFGDDPLESKLKSDKRIAADSLLYHSLDHAYWWMKASPEVASGNEHLRWDEDRLLAFQEAIQRRVLGLYQKYYEACSILTFEEKAH